MVRDRPPVLLVVDDDASVRSSLHKGLGREGYDVRLASNAQEALAVVGTSLPDLVLLDVMLPGGPNGYEICRELKSRAEMALVPIIFVTALDSHQDEAKAFAVGGTAYVVKPFELSELAKAIEDTLHAAARFEDAAKARAERAAASERAAAEARASAAAERAREARAANATAGASRPGDGASRVGEASGPSIDSSDASPAGEPAAAVSNGDEMDADRDVDFEPSGAFDLDFSSLADVEDPVQRDAEPGGEADGVVEAGAAVGAEAEVDVDAESGVEAEADVQARAEASAEINADAETNAAADSEVEAESGLEAEAEAGAAAAVDVDVQIEATVIGEVEAEAIADFAPEADSGAEAAAEAEDVVADDAGPADHVEETDDDVSTLTPDEELAAAFAADAATPTATNEASAEEPAESLAAAPTYESGSEEDEEEGDDYFLPAAVREKPIERVDTLAGRPMRDKLAPKSFTTFVRYMVAERGASPAREAEASACKPDDVYVLARILHIPEENLARYIARFLDVPYLQRVHSDDLALGVLPKAFCESNAVLPVRRTTDEIGIVLSNPFNWDLMDTLNRTVWRDQEPRISITAPETITHVFQEATDQLLRVPTFEELARNKDPDFAVEEDDGNPALLLANELLRAACEERASDLHIEPKDRHTLVRFRIDGDMQDVRTLEKQAAARLISRFKALAGMDIAERRKPQDGSVEVIIEERRLKMRFATSSTSDGETMVIRLLEPTKRATRLEHLGMATSQVKALQTMANRHQGMILVVGPTGSGKSTTIFSLLTNVDGHSRSIMSVEDPVEYRIPFANQQEVNEKAGVTFESLLRSAMRQDPDILFLGEIRDTFSAKAALDFASSGHLTVSTLHCANATSTIFRLERLGVERASMADSLLGIVAQKLVKRLCPHCRLVREILPLEHDLLSGFSDKVPQVVAEPVGCPSCRETGYLGREAVYEILHFDPALGEMVRSDASIHQIRQFCVDRGDVMMYDHALEKVRQLVFSPNDAYELVFLEESRFRQASDARASLGLGTAEEKAQGQEQASATVAASAPPVEATSVDQPDWTEVIVVGGEEAEPAAAPSPAPPAPSTTTPSASPAKRDDTVRILVAEDDPVTLKMVESILSRAGYHVTCVNDGAEALFAFHQDAFDVIVSDLHMPNLTGMQLLELLVAKEMHTPVIFLTSERDVTVEGRAFAAGAADFIRKPVNSEILLARVRNSVGRRPAATAEA